MSKAPKSMQHILITGLKFIIRELKVLSTFLIAFNAYPLDHSPIHNHCSELPIAYQVRLVVSFAHARRYKLQFFKN